MPHFLPFHLRRSLLPALGLLLLVFTGFTVRRTVFEAQSETPSLVPFTLESALHYRRIREVFLGNGIPALDPAIQPPNGIRTYQTDTVGSELAVGRLARILPDLWTLPERVRWLHVVWFSIGIAWMALWVRWMTNSWVGGWISGLFYATALSSVIRSTGQELSHENVALPFLLAHLALDARAAISERSAGRLFARGASALALGLALCTWDMIQYYIGLRSLWFLLYACRSPAPQSAVRGERLPEISVLFLVGILHPYFQSHCFLQSPAFCLYVAAELILWLRKSGRIRGGVRQSLAGAGGLLLAFLPSRMGGFSDRYGHFGNLLLAKIRFLNLKPSDPAWLDFDQRIMWTPALHSATGALILQLFPYVLALTGFATVVYYLQSGVRNGETEPSRRMRGSLVFYFLISLITFVFLVRFHVFTSIFCVALLGFVSNGLLRRRGAIRWILGLLLTLGLAGEATHTLRDATKWGRNASYKEILGLASWLKEHAPGETVLANFGVSAFVLTYGGNPIVLHPKFETSDIRARVEKYGTLLFKGTEQELADWALRYGSDLYVYSRGEFSPRSPEYQMRYMVDALTPPPEAPARRFEWKPQDFTRFELLWSNARYQVYRIHPPAPTR